MAPIGIIIVTYNSAEEIGPCLEAALATNSDVIVIDNASSDGTVGEVRRRNVRLIANAENRGFAAAVNQGVAALDNRYLLLLNPDAVLQTSLDPLRAACELPDSGGAGGKLVDETGQIQAGFMARELPTVASLILEVILLNRCWPKNPINRRYRILGRNYDTQFAVGQPAGAFLMVPRDVGREVGWMDEGFYPVWFEDVDLCKRIRDRGKTLFYVPTAVAKHTGGHSVGRMELEKRRYYWYRSLLRYSAKHFGRGAFRVMCLSVLLGSVLRGLVESVTNRRIQPAQSYGRVIRLAGRSLLFGFRP